MGHVDILDTSQRYLGLREACTGNIRYVQLAIGELR